MSHKYKMIIFMGESGCGKDFAASYLCSKYPNTFHKVIPHTTRPRRDYEKDGIDYYFTDLHTFAGYVLEGTMLEASCFNDLWYYGTSIESLDANKINVAVLNPEGIENLLQDSRINATVYRIKTKSKDRLIHALEREKDPDCHEICRRFIADEQMFDPHEIYEIRDIPHKVIINDYNEFELVLDNLVKIYT